MSKSTVLLIGLGRIGFKYDLNLSKEYIFTHARAFNEHPGFELVAALDSDETQCALFQKHYHCPVYTNLAQALSIHQPDVVVVSVPTVQHYSTIKAIFECFSPKVILCEKPLSEDLEKAKQISQWCAQKNCKLFVNYMRRSDPAVIEIKQRILKGEILCPVKGVVWYSKGLFNNASHFVNLLVYWLGSIQRVFVFSKQPSWQGDPEPDFELEFERGKVCFLAAKEEYFSHYSVELIALNGRLNYQQGGRRVEWQSVESSPLFSGYRVLAETPEIIPNQMNISQWQVVDQLSRVMQGLSSELCTMDEAMYTMQNLAKIRDSLTLTPCL